MFKVFVLLLAIATGQSGIAESTKAFDTRAECEAYAPELLTMIEQDIKGRGLDGQLVIGTWKCATEAEFTSQKAIK